MRPVAISPRSTSLRLRPSSRKASRLRSKIRGAFLLWSIEPDLYVQGDRELLAQAAINLIENAQRHTPVGTVIRLTLVSARESVCLQVVDNGPGCRNFGSPPDCEEVHAA